MADNPQADTKANKQDAKEKGDKGREAKPEPRKQHDFGPDFRFLVRIHNTDLDGKKPFTTALTYVPGISHRLARVVARESGVKPQERIGNLTEAQIEKVAATIEGIGDVIPEWMMNRRKDVETGEDDHLVGSEISIMLREDLNRLKKIRSWRGHRHERKLPTRGQRTKNNGRFGSAVGVQRKAEPGAAPAEGAAPAAAAAPKAGGGGAKPLGGAKPAAAAAPAAAAGAAKPAAGGKPAGGAAKPAEKK